MPTEGSGPDLDGPQGDSVANAIAGDTADAAGAPAAPCADSDAVKSLAQLMRLLCEETRLRT